MDTGSLQTQQQGCVVRGEETHLCPVSENISLGPDLEGKDRWMSIDVLDDCSFRTSKSWASLGWILAQGATLRRMLWKASHWTYFLLTMILCGEACCTRWPTTPYFWFFYCIPKHTATLWILKYIIQSLDLYILLDNHFQVVYLLTFILSLWSFIPSTPLIPCNTLLPLVNTTSGCLYCLCRVSFSV